MRLRIVQALRSFGWRQWLVALLFVLMVAFTGRLAIRAVREAIYWNTHHEEPIRGWMTIGYVAHARDVPPFVLGDALGLPKGVPDARPLMEIARAQHRSMPDIQAILEDAILHARPPYPPPEPPSETPSERPSETQSGTPSGDGTP